jgi:hypothetical protein
MSRSVIVRINRRTGGWCFPNVSFQIEIFNPVASKAWERTSLAVWSGKTAREAIANFRRCRP